MRCSVRSLALISLCLGAVALATLSLALSTDFWVYTSEVIVPKIENVTYVEAKSTLTLHMGLWRMCLLTTILNVTSRTCMMIEYFSQEPGRIDRAAISLSISRAIRISAPFPVLAGALIVIAFIFDVIGLIKQNCKAIIAAVLYILSGLQIAIGLILYISAINDEVSYGARIKEDGKQFRYAYGWSFYFTVCAFVASEMAAATSISFIVQLNSGTRNIIRLIPGLGNRYTKWTAVQEDASELRPRVRNAFESRSTLIL